MAGPGLLSVVVPVYNSAGTLAALVERVGAVLDARGGEWELVLVNDGSTDESWARIEELARGPRVRGLDLARNYGQHNALLAGIRAARGDTIVTIDDDLQNPPEEIGKLIWTLGAMAAGAALAARLQGSQRRVYVLTSDAECNEGSVWEAAMFAAHHRLDNLVAIVDSNRQQALGYTKDVISLDPLEERWRAFGWDVHSVDGNDQVAITSAINKLPPGLPHVLIAHTTFGKGVSFMESQIRWHYLPMNDEQYVLALREIGD